MTLATIVDWNALAKVVWISLAAGIVVSGGFALAIVGAVRSAEARRAGHQTVSVAYGALLVLSLAACAYAIVQGIIFMIAK